LRFLSSGGDQSVQVLGSVTLPHCNCQQRHCITPVLACRSNIEMRIQLTQPFVEIKASPEVLAVSSMINNYLRLLTHLQRYVLPVEIK
jgi:hypothetical protein